MINNLVGRKIISSILIATTLLATKVYATNDKYNTTIRVNDPQTKRGDTITVTIGLKDIAVESGEKGIGGYTASVKFDSSVLEYVSTSNTDKWEAPLYNDGLITGNTKDGEVIKTTQDIGVITFKVKEDAKLGETTILLTNFLGTTVEKDVSTLDVSTKITVVDNNGNNDNNSNNNSDNSSDNNDNASSDNTGNSSDNNYNDSSDKRNNSNNNNKDSNSNKISNIKANSEDNTVVSGKSQETGRRNNIILIICIVLAIICFAIYRKKEKEKKRRKRKKEKNK